VIIVDQLLYKPDWIEARQRLEAWWNGRKTDRCLISVTAPRADAATLVPPQRPPTILETWTDLQYIKAWNDHVHRTTFFGGEALPVWTGWHPGHVSIPTFYGCPFKLDWETGWHDPILNGEKLDISHLKIDRDNTWWHFGQKLLEFERDQARGKSIPSMTAIFGVGDTLAMLRGNERLLLDMMDDPDGVCQSELKLMDDWFDVYKWETDIICPGGDMYTTWFGLWAPGKYYPMQCDISYGISADTFRRCYVPALRKQAQFLDYAVYHVDGVGAFHLVDELAKIERINALQILPGAGKPSPLHYSDVLHKVQRLRKGLHISIPPEEVEAALSMLSSRGLFISTWASSEKQARELIDLAGRLSVDRS